MPDVSTLSEMLAKLLTPGSRRSGVNWAMKERLFEAASVRVGRVGASCIGLVARLKGCGNGVSFLAKPSRPCEAWLPIGLDE